jgi:hypothetical protein
LDKKNEEEKESVSKKFVNPQRAKALDIAFMATRLLDEKHFDNATEAIKTKNQALFLKTCEAAEIDSEIAKAIWLRVNVESFLPGGPW